MGAGVGVWAERGVVIGSTNKLSARTLARAHVKTFARFIDTSFEKDSVILVIHKDTS
jgi:hypothetical protein